MSKSSDWQPVPGGVWDTFFTDLGFDNGEEDEDLDRCRLQCTCSENVRP